jgi:hypothetical protein
MAQDANQVRSAIVAAVRHLETAVREQEQAVTRILGLAERLADNSDRHIALQGEALFEACAFQDTTGQRIRKVEKLLRHLANMGDLPTISVAEREAVAPTAKAGLSQADIDRLLSGKSL